MGTTTAKFKKGQIVSFIQGGLHLFDMEIYSHKTTMWGDIVYKGRKFFKDRAFGFGECAEDFLTIAK